MKFAAAVRGQHRQRTRLVFLAMALFVAFATLKGPHATGQSALFATHGGSTGDLPLQQQGSPVRQRHGPKGKDDVAAALARGKDTESRSPLRFLGNEADVEAISEWERGWQGEDTLYAGLEHLQHPDWREGNLPRKADLELQVQFEHALEVAREGNILWRILIAIHVDSADHFENALATWVQVARSASFGDEVEVDFWLYTYGHQMSARQAAEVVRVARAYDTEVHEFADISNALNAVPASTAHWVLLCEDTAYVNVPQLVRRVIPEGLAVGAEKIFSGLLAGENLEPVTEAGILGPGPAFAPMQAAGCFNRWGSAEGNSVAPVVVGTVMLDCIQRHGFRLRQMPGMHVYNITVLAAKALDTTLFVDPVYEKMGPYTSIWRIPVTYGQTTNRDAMYEMVRSDYGQPRIPKIMHFIWIGDEPIPEEAIKGQESCRAMHEARGWKFMLWTNETLFDPKTNPLLLTMPGLALFKRLLSAGKRWSIHLFADIIRLGILHLYGGVYTDVDAICLRPFDRIIEDASAHGHDMVVGYESDRHYSTWIGNGVQFSAPYAQSMSALMLHLGERLMDGPKNDYDLVAWETTGPMLLTSVSVNWNSWVRWKILPSNAFYPVHPWDFLVGPGIGHEDAHMYAWYKGSYTLQLFRGRPAGMQTPIQRDKGRLF